MYRKQVVLRACRDPGTTKMVLGPKLANWSLAKVCAPWPIPIMATTEALPMIIPSIVRPLRTLLAPRVETAIFKLSMINISVISGGWGAGCGENK